MPISGGRPGRRRTLSKMNVLLFFQKEVGVDDGFGGKTMEWENAHPEPVWGSLESPSSFMRLQAAQADYPITHYLRVRFDPCIEPSMRICLQDNRKLRILNMYDEDSRGEWLIIEAQEGAGT